MLFDEQTLHKLNQLSLVARQARAGVMKGERRSIKRGTSVEFADYRNYTPGDDLRRLDWNVYARLERPFIKLMEEEEDLAVYVLLDVSRSMDFGADTANKLDFGLHLAAALGAIALGAGDRLNCSVMDPAAGLAQHGQGQVGQGQVTQAQSVTLRGSAQLMRLMTWLEGQAETGRKNRALPNESAPTGQKAGGLAAALRSFAAQPNRPGLLFILSDLLDPATLDGSLFASLNLLLGRTFEIAVLHILCPDELDPPLAGDLRLVDVENGQAQDLSLDGGMRSLYRQRLQAWQGGIEQDCRRRGVHYLLLDTAQPWDRAVLFNLRQAGLVKG